MMVQFILMTIAFVIMLIVAILQQRRIKELNKNYHDLYDEGFQKYMGFGKVYRRKYKYMVIGAIIIGLIFIALLVIAAICGSKKVPKIFRRIARKLSKRIEGKEQIFYDDSDEDKK